MSELFDDVQLHELAADLVASIPATMTATIATTVKAVKNIQREAKAAAPHGPHTSHYAASITTSTKRTALTFTAEVGPLQRGMGGQGSFGEIFEFGTARTDPQPHLMPAADAEIPSWLRYMLAAAGSSI